MRRARFDLPLTEVPAGEYVARARVRARGESAGEPRRQVQILGGTARTTAPAPAPGPDTEPAWNPRDLLDGDLVRDYVASLKRDPASPASKAALAGIDLFRRGSYAEAARALDEALTLNPRSAPAAFTLGWAHEAAGARREAIGAWRAAAVLDPTLVPAHLALADAYLRLSEPALAVQALRAGLAALPDSLELRHKLARIQGRE
jgi:tetratricopeptide (TPR) repeat protein